MSLPVLLAIADTLLASRESEASAAMRKVVALPEKHGELYDRTSREPYSGIFRLIPGPVLAEELVQSAVDAGTSLAVSLAQSIEPSCAGGLILQYTPDYATVSGVFPFPSESALNRAWRSIEIK